MPNLFRATMGGNGGGSDIKPYIVDFTCHSGYIGQTITMHYLGIPHAEEEVDDVSGVVNNDGLLTLYPMHDGEWEISSYSTISGEHITSCTFEKWGHYPITLIDKPNGETVMPINDIQTWLHCAIIWDKSYTTVAEVLSDSTTLNALIQDENAVNYLERSTDFANEIVANQTAMTYIGNNNYCANKLLSNNSWLASICNSTYFEKVLNVKVPEMTSNTTPSGEVKTYGQGNTATGAWTAFSVASGTGTYPAVLTNSGYYAYKFTKKVKVNKVLIQNHSNQSYLGECVNSFKIKGSNDGSTWVDVDGTKTRTNQNASASTSTVIINDKGYQWYAIFPISTFGGTAYSSIAYINFYGREV